MALKISRESVEHQVDLLEQLYERENSPDAPFEGEWLPSGQSAAPTPPNVPSDLHTSPDGAAAST